MVDDGLIQHNRDKIIIIHEESELKKKKGGGRNIENTSNAAFLKVIAVVRTVIYKPVKRQIYLKCLAQ